MTSTIALPCRSAVSDMTLLRVEGKDAVRFLHGQFTNRIEGLTGRVVSAGYCSPKGRLLAVFRAWTAEDGAAMLFLPTSRAAGFMKRMKMFVLRDDVRFTDVTEAFTVELALGLADAPKTGEHVRREEADLLGLQPTTDTPGFLPAATRTLIVRAKNNADDAAEVAPLTFDLWRASEIAAGVPQVFETTMEAFVPQAVNLELVDGVVFNKGCYPGQEVVSRVQHIGETPRRGAIVLMPTSTAPAPGTLLDEADAVVVDALSNGTETLAFLCAKTAGVPATVGATLPLPYAVRNVLKD